MSGSVDIILCMVKNPVFMTPTYFFFKLLAVPFSCFCGNIDDGQD